VEKRNKRVLSGDIYTAIHFLLRIFGFCGPHFGYHVDKCGACIWFDSYNQIQAPVLTRHHIKLGMLRVKPQGVQTRV
jgi:hypothetical protein